MSLQSADHSIFQWLHVADTAITMCSTMQDRWWHVPYVFGAADAARHTHLIILIQLVIVILLLTQRCISVARLASTAVQGRCVICQAARSHHLVVFMDTRNAYASV